MPITRSKSKLGDTNLVPSPSAHPKIDRAASRKRKHPQSLTKNAEYPVSPKHLSLISLPSRAATAAPTTADGGYTSALAFDDMPDHAISAVLQRVPVRDRIVAERVSHRFFQLVQDSWKQLRYLNFSDVIARTWERYGEPSAEPQILLQCVLARVGAYLTSLNFASCSTFRMSRYTLELIGQYCPQLAELNLSGRVITAKGLDGLKNLPASLHTLKLSRCFESGSYETKKAVDRALTSLLPGLPNLVALYAEHNKSEQFWGKGGMWVSRLKLRSLAVGSCALNADAFSTFISGNVGFIREFRASESTFASGNWSNIDLCRRLLKKALSHWKQSLEVLELRDFSGSFSSVLGEAVRVVPSLLSLRALSLKSNRFVDDDLLSAICDSCVQLESINLSCCYGVKRKGLSCLKNLPRLKHIDLRRLSAVDNELIGALCLRGELTVVGLRECTRVTKDILDVLILNCPYLQEVDLTGCKRIPPDSGIREQYASCDHIVIRTSTVSPLLRHAASPPIRA